MFNKKEYDKKYREEHKEEKKKYRRLYYKKHYEEQKNYSRQYAKNHPEEVKERRKLYYKNHRERELKLVKQYQKINSGKIKEYRKKHYQEGEKEYNKQYRINNPGKVRESQRKCCAKKYRTDLKFKLNSRMANTVKKALKGNKQGRHWETLVGYTLEDLIKRLKKTMPKGYCWQDYLDGRLHIDHIIPKSVFNYTKPEHPDFRRCWALDNLRLLPARENIIKSNELYKPFQPALQLS